jgi:predicted amidophosphoribosyltransferase
MTVSPSRARFRLCLECFRAVPVDSKEVYCINDGTKMIEACPRCGTHITSPYAHFCPTCGLEYRSHSSALNSMGTLPVSVQKPARGSKPGRSSTPKRRS